MSSTEAAAISPDELAYLKAIGRQEQAMLAAMRAARESYETHLAGKYGLVNGDKIADDGAIVRVAADK